MVIEVGGWYGLYLCSRLLTADFDKSFCWRGICDYRSWWLVWPVFMF